VGLVDPKFSAKHIATIRIGPCAREAAVIERT
jgi:hypothetical protein